MGELNDSVNSSDSDGMEHNKTPPNEMEHSPTYESISRSDMNRRVPHMSASLSGSSGAHHRRFHWATSHNSSSSSTSSSSGSVPITTQQHQATTAIFPLAASQAAAAAAAAATNNNCYLHPRICQLTPHASPFLVCPAGVERPAHLDRLLQKRPLPLTDQMQHTWSPMDHSSNIYITHANPMTFHRHPVAQSTDAARGKQGYNKGLHLWRIHWPRSQRGTHAVVGVGSEDAPLHANSYLSLLGEGSSHSWGWNLSSNTLHHNSTCYGDYPSINMQHKLLGMEVTGSSIPGGPLITTTSSGDSVTTATTTNGNGTTTSTTKPTYKAPDDIYVVLDMDEGTLGFLVNEEFLGYAFHGLKGRTLHPMVSAVWGHCEVTLEYINGLPPEPHSLMHSSRKSIRSHMERCQLDLLLLDTLDLPRLLKDYLLYRYR